MTSYMETAGMPVDDVSLTLGRLDASVAELIRQCRALFSKGDETTVQVHAMAATVEQLALTVEEMKKELKEIRALRDRGRGFVAALTLVAGGVGAIAGKLIALLSAH